MEKKRAAFAGSWYPSTASECESRIRGFLTEHGGPRQEESFAGGIVPHAGWVYSGSIACNVIASVASGSGTPIDTVILFGAHMHKQSEPFIMTHGACETPFGDLEIDEELVSAILSGIGLRPRSPAKFPDENTLELQYPFIKYFFPGARLVTCGVAPSNFAAMIGTMAVMEAKNLGKNIRVIGSTDMTHYGRDFGFTPKGDGREAVEWVKTVNDSRAVDAMTAMDDRAIIHQGLENHNMCCAGAAAATAAACRTMGSVRGLRYAYSTSCDKSGRTSSFVGYAGILYPL